MAPRKRTILSKEEIAKKKSEKAKRRLEKNKNDPVLLAEYKEKERLKYLKKKEKGQRKCVKDMTPREHRKARKKWVAYSSDYRNKQKIRKNTDKYMDQCQTMAPDAIGATCKRSADQLIAQRGDITNLYDFVAVFRERCPNIQISVIEDDNIEKVNTMIKEHEKEQKQFKGTLLVHQVSGDIYNPNRLILKSLSCFCDNVGCNHYNLGTITYQSNTHRLQVSDIFTDSEDDMPLASVSNIAQEKSKTSYGSGDYVLVKLIMRRKEYRYAAICSKYDDEDGELTVTFLKVCNEDGTEFKINDNDIAEDVIEKLPVPNPIVKKNTVFYKFKKPINVYEK